MAFPRLTFRVESVLDGIRIDSFLAKHLRNYSPYRLARMVAAGLACVSQGPVPIERRVFAGEEVTLICVEPPDLALPATAVPLDVVFEDPWLMVVHKPAGMVAHPTGDHQSGTLLHACQAWLDQQTLFPGLLRPGIVHRLDRQTSGLMVVCKEHLSHRVLGEAFHAGRVAKSYLALLQGSPPQDSGVINLPIGRSPVPGTVLMSTRAEARDRKPARTSWRVLDRKEGVTLVLARPHTGRNHQIRIHFASLGYPLLGEPFYNHKGELHPRAPAHDPADGEEEAGDRHALHACQLGFGHPVTGAWLEFSSAMPADLLLLWQKADGLTTSQA